MSNVEDIQKDWAAINTAAGEFLQKLTAKDIKKDIILASEMSGLTLYRGSPANAQPITPGVVVLGAVPEEAMNNVWKFVFAFFSSNGIDPQKIPMAKATEDAMGYLPELTSYEAPFHEVCAKNAVSPALRQFVAAASAAKLVISGHRLKLIPITTGFPMMMFHIIAGSKTAPYPVEAPEK